MPRKLPPKPYPEFPLYPAQNGQWRKSLWNARTRKTEVYCFGPWDDDPKGERALVEYMGAREAIKNGTYRATIAVQQGDYTVCQLEHDYLDARLADFHSHKLTASAYATLVRTIHDFGRWSHENVGPQAMVGGMKIEFFAAYVRHLLETRKLGPHAEKRVKSVIKSMFKWAAENGRAPLPAFGTAWKAPNTSKAAMRAYRIRAGIRDTSDAIWTGSQIDAVVKIAPWSHKAMILMSVNSAPMDDCWDDTGFLLKTGPAYTSVSGADPATGIITKPINGADGLPSLYEATDEPHDCGDPAKANATQPNYIPTFAKYNWKFLDTKNPFAQPADPTNPNPPQDGCVYTVQTGKFLVSEGPKDATYLRVISNTDDHKLTIGNDGKAALTFRARSRDVFWTQAVDPGPTQAIASYMWKVFNLTNTDANHVPTAVNPPDDPYDDSRQLFFWGNYAGQPKDPADPRHQAFLKDPKTGQLLKSVDIHFFEFGYNCVTPRGKFYVCAHGSVPWPALIPVTTVVGKAPSQPPKTQPRPEGGYGSSQEAWEDWLNQDKDVHGNAIIPVWAQMQMPPASTIMDDYGLVFLDGITKWPFLGFAGPADDTGTAATATKNGKKLGDYKPFPLGFDPEKGRPDPSHLERNKYMVAFLGGAYVESHLIACCGATPSAGGKSIIQSYANSVSKTIAGGGSIGGYDRVIHIRWEPTVLPAAAPNAPPPGPTGYMQLDLGKVNIAPPVTRTPLNQNLYDSLYKDIYNSMLDDCGSNPSEVLTCDIYNSAFNEEPTVFNGVKYVVPGMSPNNLVPTVLRAIASVLSTSERNIAKTYIDKLLLPKGATIHMAPCFGFDLTQVSIAGLDAAGNVVSVEEHDPATGKAVVDIPSFP